MIHSLDQTIPRVAVVGSGPAGLMAADTLAQAGFRVCLFEKRKALGRKLLVAGSSGLNITSDCPDNEFASYYEGPRPFFENLFKTFGAQAWIRFIESELGVPTFKGTSRRYFVGGSEDRAHMKASQLLKNWTERLKKLGVEIVPGQELVDFESLPDRRVMLAFADGTDGASGESTTERAFDGAILSLGGGSWEPQENPLRWIAIFQRKGLSFAPFQSANCGYEVDWPRKLLEEAEGKPIKNVVLTSSQGTRAGELVITRYGLEGTPIYFVGTPGTAYLDLKPELEPADLYRRLSSGRENLSPIRRVKKFLRLSEGADALVFHLLPPDVKSDFGKLAAALKRFPIVLKKARPLEEAISSRGGVRFEELDGQLMLRRFPGIYAAGEMIDWHAPTGGFLIQASVSQGRWAAKGLIERLSDSPRN